MISPQLVHRCACDCNGLQKKRDNWIEGEIAHKKTPLGANRRGVFSAKQQEDYFSSCGI